MNVKAMSLFPNNQMRVGWRMDAHLSLEKKKKKE
jgi:hypothetical protein